MSELSVTEIRAGSLEPLVCLHGFMGCAADWQFLAAALPDRPVLAVDLPGHGGSLDLPDEAYTVEGACRFVIRELDARKIGRFHLLGYSLGGRVALALAMAHPVRCASLVLESASPGLADDASRHQRAEVDDERAVRLRTDGMEAFLDTWYDLPLFVSQSVALREARKQSAIANDPGELARAVAGMSPGRQEAYAGRLGSLAMPVTYVSGELDEQYVSIGRSILERAPTVIHHVVRGAGHNVHLERQAEFIEIVRLHLSNSETWHR